MKKIGIAIPIIITVVIIIIGYILIKGITLQGLPDIDEVESVNISDERTNTTIQFISGNEDIEFAVNVSHILLYKLGKTNDHNPIINIQYNLKNGQLVNLSVNETTAKLNGEIYKLKADSGTKFIKMVEAKFLNNTSGNSDHKYIPLEELDEDYSLEEAINDQLIVFEDSDITHGQQQWDLFVGSTNKGEPSMVRLAKYYTLGDSAQYSKEAYEEMKDEYPVMIIQDLVFNGSDYVIKYYEDNVLTSDSYKYMMKYEGKANPEAIYSGYTYYVLVNERNVSWADIEKGMYSSRSGDWIDHHKVYSNIILKEDYDINQSEDSSKDLKEEIRDINLFTWDVNPIAFEERTTFDYTLIWEDRLYSEYMYEYDETIYPKDKYVFYEELPSITIDGEERFIVESTQSQENIILRDDDSYLWSYNGKSLQKIVKSSVYDYAITKSGVIYSNPLKEDVVYYQDYNGSGKDIAFEDLNQLTIEYVDAPRGVGASEEKVCVINQDYDFELYDISNLEESIWTLSLEEILDNKQMIIADLAYTDYMGFKIMDYADTYVLLGDGYHILVLDIDKLKVIDVLYGSEGLVGDSAIYYISHELVVEYSLDTHQDRIIGRGFYPVQLVDMGNELFFYDAYDGPPPIQKLNKQKDYWDRIEYKSGAFVTLINEKNDYNSYLHMYNHLKQRLTGIAFSGGLYLEQTTDGYQIATDRGMYDSDYVQSDWIRLELPKGYSSQGVECFKDIYSVNWENDSSAFWYNSDTKQIMRRNSQGEAVAFYSIEDNDPSLDLYGILDDQLVENIVEVEDEIFLVFGFHLLRYNEDYELIEDIISGNNSRSEGYIDVDLENDKPTFLYRNRFGTCYYNFETNKFEQRIEDNSFSQIIPFRDKVYVDRDLSIYYPSHLDTVNVTYEWEPKVTLENMSFYVSRWKEYTLEDRYLEFMINGQNGCLYMVEDNVGTKISDIIIRDYIVSKTGIMFTGYGDDAYLYHYSFETNTVSTLYDAEICLSIRFLLDKGYILLENERLLPLTLNNGSWVIGNAMLLRLISEDMDAESFNYSLIEVGDVYYLVFERFSNGISMIVDCQNYRIKKIINGKFLTQGSDLKLYFLQGNSENYLIEYNLETDITSVIDSSGYMMYIGKLKDRLLYYSTDGEEDSALYKEVIF